MHRPDHLLPLFYLQAFNQDVGIRMRRLRGLEYADAATQAQGTATRTIPCGRSSCYLSAFDSPFHATRLAASFRCDSRFWRQLRSFNLGLFFVYLSLLISLFLSNRSILRSSSLSNYLARYAFLVNLTVSSCSELYQYNLIDNDILALLYPSWLQQR
jgi:hypothetical protein